jgi:hypothetical protein
MQAATGEKILLRPGLGDSEVISEVLEADGRVAWLGKVWFYYGWNMPRAQLLRDIAAVHGCSALEMRALVGQSPRPAAAKKEARCLELPLETCPWRWNGEEGASLQGTSIRGRWRLLRTTRYDK